MERLWFRHDANARSDPKIVALIRRHGLEGYGRFWTIIETLASQKEYKLKNAPWMFEGLADSLKCQTEEAETFLNELVEDFELLQTDQIFFWSESLCQRMEARDSKIRSLSEAGKKGAEKRWGGYRVANGPYMGGHEGANGGLMAPNSEGGSEGVEGVENHIGRKASIAHAWESFLKNYKKATKREHPGVAPKTREAINRAFEDIFDELEEIGQGPEVIDAIIEQFFEDWQAGDLEAEDPTVWLFADPKVWRYRGLRADVFAEESVFDVDGKILEGF